VVSRWCSVDPILYSYLDGKPSGGIFNSVNLNLYHYASNNPIVFLDPNGCYTINKEGSVGFNKKTDTVEGAAKLAGYGDNWRAAVKKMGVSNRFDSNGRWKSGSKSLVGMSLKGPKSAQLARLRKLLPMVKGNFDHKRRSQHMKSQAATLSLLAKTTKARAKVTAGTAIAIASMPAASASATSFYLWMQTSAIPKITVLGGGIVSGYNNLVSSSNNAILNNINKLPGGFGSLILQHGPKVNSVGRGGIQGFTPGTPSLSNGWEAGGWGIGTYFSGGD